MLAADHIRDAVLAYAKAISTGDIDAIVALFAENATFEDPIEDNLMRGPAEIRAFFEMSYNYVRGTILMEPAGEVRVARRHAACAFIARCPEADPPFCTATLDTFEFDDAGLFTKVQAYFGDSNRHPADWRDAPAD